MVGLAQSINRLTFTRRTFHNQKPNPPRSFSRCLASDTFRQWLHLLNSCSSIKQLFQIQSRIITRGLENNPHIVNKIIQFCTVNSIGSEVIKLINHAHRIIIHSQNLEPSSWNHVIRAYASLNCELRGEAIWVFLAMRRSGVKPNEHSFPFLFKVCASLSRFSEGRQIHGDVMKHGLHDNMYVQNTLIHFYGSCKRVVDAYMVFDGMSFRTIVSWNSLISACVESSWFYNSVEVFMKMAHGGFQPDETTMVILLSVCAEMGNLTLGKWVHSQVIEKGLDVDYQLGTALVEMYSKCGAVDYAKLVFDRMAYRNVWTWSAMILGFAQNGFANQALELFAEMKSSSIEPNYVTFVGVFCACSHSGLVENGYCFFHQMEHVYKIKPMMTHYGAMVDLLGRAGRLKEAYNFIEKMPFKADSIVWRTVLSACRVHDPSDYSGVAENVAKKLIDLEPRRSGNLVMVANAYAEVGLFDKAEEVRRTMRFKGLKKRAGESCLELGGSIFRFFSGDGSDVKCEDIFVLLDRLNFHVKMIDFE